MQQMGREQGLNIPKTSPKHQGSKPPQPRLAGWMYVEGNVEGTLSGQPELVCHTQITYGSLVATSLETYLLGRRCGLCGVSHSRMPAFGAYGGCEIVSTQFT